MMQGFLNSLSNLLILAQAETIESGSETAETVASQWEIYGTGAAYVLGIFVIPFILGGFISKAVRMPTHSFRIGVMLAAIFGGLLFAYGNNFQMRLGADMKGGTNLVYDIMPDEETGQRVNAGNLASALSDRINPSGTKEITIRPRGESQIEIIVPATDPGELEELKRRLQASGQLEFRIVANGRDHQDVIELARQQAKSNATVQSNVYATGGDEPRVVGKWFTVGREEKKKNGIFPLKTPVLSDVLRDSYTGKLIENPPLNRDEDYALEQWMAREGIKEVDVLMAYEVGQRPYAVVNGDDLSSAATEFDKSGYVVSFRLNQTGAQAMAKLTSANQPDGEFHRRMAIIMDGKVLSAPQLNSTIYNSGQITGNFTKEEVDFLVTILRSGRLPATLSDKPASEERVGAGLGATTIQKGTNASIWAVIATFACILVYYRFAGIVASMALIINGLLIFGVMIFIGQPLTLPGLAGLVLTVGMSVDANVLIFERIREEKNKGSAPRMSIRNGFDRAFTTIIDSNLTTLIAAIVLYWIGTEQVRGFAVALVIGIVTSMFTATFCSRIVFEIAEKMKLVSLSMSDGVGFLKRSFLGEGDVNFMGWKQAAFVLSMVLIVGGLVSVFLRGGDLLNIDFTGGTSVTMQLQDPIGPEELRTITRNVLTVDQENKPVQSTLVRVEKEPQDTVYTLVTSIDDEEYLAEQLVQGFAKESGVTLKTYRIKVLGSGEETGWIPGDQAYRFVSFRSPQEEGAETTLPTAEPTAPATGGQEGGEAAAGGEADSTAADSAAGDEAIADAVPVAQRSEFILEVAGSTDDMANVDDADKGAKVDANTLKNYLVSAAKASNIQMNEIAVEVMPEPMPENWRPDDIAGFSKWRVVLPVDDASAQTVVAQLQQDMETKPLWLSLSKIGTRVAGEMKQRAVAAILLSLIFIVAYIWFRFQKVAYGLAAVVALVHDVLITLGVLAACHWLAGPLQFLLIEDFKIGLTEVAAFLTIIGYSLNDTIVVFDRIREVRGRSPRLTAEMINESVNQTLSRTLLTSGTTLLTVVLLYVFGGEGIHAFAFALLIGVLVGTYSSIFVASPVLLWISNRENAKQRPGVTA